MSRTMGMMEKRERAKVMMPMVMPPVLSVTQQQHRFRHGIAYHSTTSRNVTPVTEKKSQHSNNLQLLLEEIFLLVACKRSPVHFCQRIAHLCVWQQLNVEAAGAGITPPTGDDVPSKPRASIDRFDTEFKVWSVGFGEQLNVFKLS